MNDPNKVINVNLSSLLSLKAELLRKQAEVNKAKVAQAITSANEQEYTSHKQSNKQNNDYEDDIHVKKKDKKKRSKEVERTKEVTVYEHEDYALLEKSQKVLEAKAKFYERMQKTGGKLNSDDNCLVMFNKKKQEDIEESRNNIETGGCLSESCIESDDSDHSDDPEDEWVEYTDCLGRTRTCLKRDLDQAKRKDEKLAASMPERLDQTKANWMIDTMGCHESTQQDQDEDQTDVIGPLPPSVFGDGYSTVSKLEEQKANWERKEQENLEKTDVHYQDVFFDEARQHGVGYYAFSTDEEERRKQQRELEKARQQTLEEQKRREALKEQREKIIAERVLAAKNRQRARLGLPPLEKEVENEKKDSVEESKKQRKERKKAAKLEMRKLIEEKERENERLNHIRPWDKEKDGLPKHKTPNNEENEEWQYKPEREPMTQEQWNEFKRNERIENFAPPPTFRDNPFKRTNFKLTDNSTSVPNYNNVQAPESSGFSKYQSTKTSKSFKRRYVEPAQPPDDFPTTSSCINSGVCIPPPSNLEDFHLPSYNKKSKSSHELEQSIEAGLRFLRNNSDKEMPSTKSAWTAKADY